MTPDAKPNVAAHVRWTLKEIAATLCVLAVFVEMFVAVYVVAPALTDPAERPAMVARR